MAEDQTTNVSDWSLAPGVLCYRMTADRWNCWKMRQHPRQTGRNVWLNDTRHRGSDSGLVRTMWSGPAASQDRGGAPNTVLLCSRDRVACATPLLRTCWRCWVIWMRQSKTTRKGFRHQLLISQKVLGLMLIFLLLSQTSLFQVKIEDVLHQKAFAKLALIEDDSVISKPSKIDGMFSQLFSITSKPF